MKQKVVVNKSMAWLSILPQMALWAAIVYGFKRAGSEDYILYGSFVFMLLYIVLRNGVANSHRQGIRLTKKGEFKDAIKKFEKSYQFFQTNQWVDQFRYITILSASSMSYSEMALTNIAYCYGQMGDGEKARKYYNKALSYNPDNTIAQTALNLMDSVSNKEQMEP